MADDDEIASLEKSVAEIADRLFASGTVESTLQAIVAIAEETVDGCDAAGVLTVDADDVARTVAASSPMAAALDGLQIAADEGPCLDAARSGQTFYADDLAEETRWPRFVPAALEQGTRSVLAYSLSSQRLSALNMYGNLPGAFGAIDRGKGQIFATLARHALDVAEAQAKGDLKSAGLTEALRTRELIGQAMGILMERERITSDQAFDVLRRASQHLNVKLREVAVRLVETGEYPETRSPDPPG